MPVVLRYGKIRPRTEYLAERVRTFRCGFVFRQHKAVTDVLRCTDDVDDDNYYCLFLVCRRRKTIATIRAKYMFEKARHVITVRVTSTCSHDVWNIVIELIGTGSM
jgi:hypothetical protein